MSFSVEFSGDAAQDLRAIYRYIAEHDSAANAERVVAGLEQAWISLSELPERGNVPKELRDLGVTEFRELHYKPYRMLYRIFGQRVVIFAILDGRRDMGSVLRRRLLR